MEYSNLLQSQKAKCQLIIDRLMQEYDYVTILGSHNITKIVRVDDSNTNVDTRIQAGYTIRMYANNHYYEYSTDNILIPLEELVLKIKQATILDPTQQARIKDIGKLQEEKIKQHFDRPNVGKDYTIPEIKEELAALHQQIKAKNELVVSSITQMITRYVSTMYLSPNKDLEQFYTWTNLMLMAIVRRDRNMKNHRVGINYNSIEQCLKEAKDSIDELVSTAIELLDATAIEPGYYDVVVDPSVAGLIAHEAFGHGVELDMFVKDRAKAKNYVEDYVASPILSMKDGAASALSAASYFFDDDGVLAHDTLIIENGILKHGISDALSALQLNQEPTGNGRRESYLKKAYSRMTNTFFLPREDELEDMIQSIDYGYMICGSSNGMEDPKNWQIQCVASYGREIKDGKFTGKIVAPVVISGYVPDLLKSITMISKEYKVFGSGMCGKGHKEWVFVSDGGPYMKAKVKLG